LFHLVGRTPDGADDHAIVDLEVAWAAHVQEERRPCGADGSEDSGRSD